MRRVLSGVDRQFRIKRGFVRIVNSGEAHALALGNGLARLLVKALGVALLAHLNCRLHMDFDERNGAGLVLLVDGPGRVAILAIRADEARQRDESGVGEELGDLADSADVFLAIVS